MSKEYSISMFSGKYLFSSMFFLFNNFCDFPVTLNLAPSKSLMNYATRTWFCCTTKILLRFLPTSIWLGIPCITLNAWTHCSNTSSTHLWQRVGTTTVTVCVCVCVCVCVHMNWCTYVWGGYLYSWIEYFMCWRRYSMLT